MKEELMMGDGKLNKMLLLLLKHQVPLVWSLYSGLGYCTCPYVAV